MHVMQRNKHVSVRLAWINVPCLGGGGGSSRQRMR